jgi:hypothetical protein
MSTPAQRLFEEYRAQLSLMDEIELIMRFNKEVGNPGWGTARASFLAAIHKEFDRRGINYSNIGDSDGISLKHHVLLTEFKELVPVAN